MKFRAEHVMRGVSIADYERLYFDEAFNEAMCTHLRLSRQLIELQTTGQRLTRVVKVGPDRSIPAPVAKILGANKIEYTEHLDYTLGSYRGTWRTVSSIMADKVACAGTFAFVGQAGGVLRTVEGAIDVKIFGLGGVVERFIVADVEGSYAQAARFTQEWLDGHRQR